MSSDATLKFGTSGVRGLVTAMTDHECYLYTKAFIQYLKSKGAPEAIAVGGDLRGSTPRIAAAVMFAAREEGLRPEFCGFVATPAVMNHALARKIPSVMVTGSHIPDDRNGIKFNMPWGEVLKSDEAVISRRHTLLKLEETGAEWFTPEGAFTRKTLPEPDPVSPAARKAYVRRFVDFFPAGCLGGVKIVFYEHSSVSREVLPDILKQLGAAVATVGRSDAFVPVDTEAVENPEQLAAWVKENGADALVSTDGDADRPLVVDENGRVIRGDVLGILVAHFLEADSVSTPVSCNTALEKTEWFDEVRRTRIGSPYVIEAMMSAVESGRRVVVGYEANGGFLTATDVVGSSGGTLRALPTRDAALPIIAVLLAARREGKTLSELVEDLPARFTASGLIREFPNDTGRALVERFEKEGREYANAVFSKVFGEVQEMDFTDGARLTFASGDIVHVRPSGNAPEFRVYSEASLEQRAADINHMARRIVERLKTEVAS